MKKLSKIALAVASGALALGAATSCSSDLDLHPNSYFTYQTFWKTKGEFQSFIPAQMQMFRANYPAQIFFSAGELRAGTLWKSMLDGSGNANPDYIDNLYTRNATQFSNFGGWWGFIANWNQLIKEATTQEGIIDDDMRDGMLAMAYGMRAYSYFQMYRMYGGLPLRLEPDVADGVTDPIKLFKKRSTAEETLAQIKSDIDQSLKYFAASTYTYNASKKYYYWNVNATKVLAAQVYLWSGKVATGDHEANPADVTKAKEYYLDVLNNGGYSLLPNYFDNWMKPGNSETIFSVNYTSMDDKVFQNIGVTNFLWSRSTGAATGAYWSNIGDTFDKKLDNKVRWFGYNDDASAMTPLWNNTSFGVQRYQYKNALYFQFEDGDQRKDAWYPCWYPTVEEDSDPNLLMIENFDYKTHDLAGCFTLKYRPQAVDGYQYWQLICDMAVFRLADVYLGLAECYNYEGNNTEMAKYLNALRQRAYGENYDAAKHAYVPGLFKDNEVAILHEADKEYFNEGRRWWDLRRLTTVKNGAQTDHLVFAPEGCVGWGLDVANCPWMKEMDRTPCVTDDPVMPTSWEYRLLWPIDSNTLGADEALNDGGKGQNPGYN